MEKFENRLVTYKEKYGEENILSQFSYNQSAEQIIYRNEALRMGTRGLYADYLGKHLDLDTESELKSFDSMVPRILKLDRPSFLAWATDKGIELVESDIYIFDEDAILKGIRLDDAEMENYDVESSWNELIHNLHKPEELAKERAFFWVLDE